MNKFILLFYSCIPLLIQAQSSYVLPQVSPRSPDAAAFEKYGTIPVSLTSGMAQVNIPLYTIKAGTLEIPVVLSYQNNGLKMDEIPGSAGLGWTIQAGGLINYEQRGLPDFITGNSRGMFSSRAGYSPPDSLNRFLHNKMNSYNAYKYLQQLADGEVDGEFDFYNYTLPGYSGSFFHDTGQQIIQVPVTDLRISRQGSDVFTITDIKGNIFTFGVTDYNEATEITEFPLQQNFSGNATYYLSRIITPGNQYISYAYTPFPFSYTGKQHFAYIMSETAYPGCPLSKTSISHTRYNLANHLLTQINFTGGKILFEMSTATRRDISLLDPFAFVPCLKKMKVLNENGRLVCEYSFHYADSNRLQLKAVIKTTQEGNPERWQFSYYDSTDIPPPFSSGKDHWGFYNGQARGLPHADYQRLVPGWKNNAITVSKESNFKFCRTGMLQKIVYPTGGHTIFTYEPNSIRLTAPGQLQGQYFLQNVTGHQLAPLLDTSTGEADEVYGSFTIDTVTPVQISAYRAWQPKALINSYVSLTRNSSTGNLLTTAPLRFECSSYGCGINAASLDLYPGTYYYTLKKYMDDSGNWSDGRAQLTISRKMPSTYSSPTRYEAGGCRILTIEHFDGTGGSTLKRYQYNDRFDSVGYINYPQYIARTGISAEYLAGCRTCGTRTTITEESMAPLSGQPVEYLYITEYDDKNGENGCISWAYTPNADHNGAAGSPYLPPFKYNWKAGLLRYRKEYRNNNGTMELIRIDSNHYESTPVNKGATRGIKVEYAQYCPLTGTGFRTFNYQLPVYFTEKLQLKSQSQLYIDSSGTISSTISSNYSADRHNQLTSTLTQGSDGNWQKELIRYSFDFDTSQCNTDEAKGIRLLQRKNMLVPVEKLFLKTIDGKDQLTAAILFTYKPDLPMPDKVFELMLTEPLPFSSFTSCSFAGGRFLKDSRYALSASFDLYNQALNILQLQSPQQPVRSLLRDYQQELPVCEVSGGAWADIAFTSFETGNHGNWMVAGGLVDSLQFFTGKKSYQQGTGSVTRTGLKPGM
ncbi:MAG: hypothetical protein ACTHMC_27600, partial [Pseudobacter sp.]|uniref:hypothetical protein n=1 Tax=Pseudobacter sp. TaxID=2045420 RepID=UPI003F7D6A17